MSSNDLVGVLKHASFSIIFNHIQTHDHDHGDDDNNNNADDNAAIMLVLNDEYAWDEQICICVYAYTHI